MNEWMDGLKLDSWLRFLGFLSLRYHFHHLLEFCKFRFDVGLRFLSALSVEASIRIQELSILALFASYWSNVLLMI